MQSSEILYQILSRDLSLRVEPAYPVGTLKQNFIELLTADGRTADTLPEQIFKDFCVQSFVEQVGLPDTKGRMTFRLSPDGRARAQARR